MKSRKGVVLIVDDDECVLFVLRQALARSVAGREIVAASSGHEALAQINRLELDLLITDIRLPGPSGIELTEALRREHQDTPVIWITAYGGTEADLQSHRLGVYRYLHKPLEIDLIRAAVRDALQAGPESP